VLVVAGPKAELLPSEVATVRAYLAGGGNGLFLLDPFVRTGLEPVIQEYGIVVNALPFQSGGRPSLTQVATVPSTGSFRNHRTSTLRYTPSSCAVSLAGDRAPPGGPRRGS
jgi:hypothetical protein